MTSQVEVLRRVAAALEETHIDYMLVGSFASSTYGERRDTHDVDIVVAMSAQSVSALHQLLSEDFYLDDESAREAIARRDMFNLIHYESGFKVDFWILKDDDFARKQFSRRIPAQIWGIQSYVESPEDTVLSKLLWSRISPSDRQISDIRGILRLSGASLDQEYLRKWAVRLNVWDALEKLIKEN